MDRKQKLKQRKDTKGLELNTSNTKLFKLAFDISPQSIYSQPNKID